LDQGSPVEQTLEAREEAYERFVRDNLKRNYASHYLHGMLGMTGFRLFNAPTFLPAYLHAISNSPTIVGVGLGLQQLGGMISPIVGATQIEHRSRVLPAAIWIGGAARLCVLGVAVAGWLLKGPALVSAIIGFMFFFGLFMGAQRVVFQLLLAKVIPIHLRGRLQAWRNVTGGIVAAALAYFAGRYLIGANVFGNGYSTTFLLAFVLTSLGISALSMLMREPQPPTLRSPARLRDRLRDLPALIAEDRAYFHFIIAQTLAVAGRIAAPFYILYVGTIIHLDGNTIGLFTTIYLGADTVSNLVWGYMGDRSGFRSILLIALAIWIAASVLLLSVHTTPMLLLAFFGLGAAQSGYMMSVSTIVLEFGARDDMPMRLAVSTTAEGVMATLGPPLGGLLAASVGYPALFLASILLLAAALGVLFFFVEDPRMRVRLASAPRA
jgi:MFS family permease